MKKSLGFLLAAVIFCTANAQTKLIEKVDAQPGKLIIPYVKYQLENGLTLIVSEDHSDPVVHVNVTYHVGSARELPGKSGFAHFFEHMLFQGSKHVADEEHFKLIRQYGGDVNGNTTRDRTVYIETFPSNFTETALWMEADRMGFFLEAFNNKKFENQRSTVKNEKGQNFTVPYGFLMEVKDQNLYPPDNPYSWSTIGYVDDLDRADSNDLKKFFLRWYGPNNAAVIVSGDVNAEEVLKWTEKYFGSINRGPEVRKQRVKPVVLTENKIMGYIDPNAYTPVIWTTYPGAPVFSPDEASLDLLIYLLGSTRNSILYKNMVEPEWALEASGSNNPLGAENHELAGEIAFQVAGYPWSDIKKLQNMLKNAIDSFEYVGFSDDDLARAKSNILNNFSNGIEDADSKARILSNYWYLMDGRAYNVEEDAQRYRNVTKEDIMRVYKKYLKGHYQSTVVIEPPPQGEEDAAERYKYHSMNPNANAAKNIVAEAEYKNLKHLVVNDNFERKMRPVPKTPVTPVIPAIYRKKLDNGLEIMGTTSIEGPKVLIQIATKGGRLHEGSKEIPMGTADLMANAMNTGTAKRTAKELENELERLGASIGFGAGATGTNISIYCDRSVLDQTLALLDEMMFQPRWDEKEYKKDKTRIKEGAKSGLRNRGTGSNNAWRALMYGETALGTYVGADEYEKVKLENCKEYYNRFFAPEVSKLVIVGNLSAEDAYTKLAFLNKWQRKNVVINKPVEFPKFETNQLFGVEYVDAEQSDLIIGFKSFPYDATGEFFKNNVMNFALGGNFNSRLNLNIREDKGWTYGIRSGFSPAFEDIPGFYSVRASVKAGATDSAISEILNELDKFKEVGISGEEFQFTKSALLASESMEYESLNQKASFIMNMAQRNLPEDYIQKQQDILKNITQKELNDLAKKNLKTDEIIIVVAGDMLLLKDRLEELGMGNVQMLEKTGKGKYKIQKAGTNMRHKKNYK